jgi:hypothetical protein|tara:strand:- start:219 stop:377 length:159 start_codon:yes stop_codon:yes gene_type:complete
VIVLSKAENPLHSSSTLYTWPVMLCVAFNIQAAFNSAEVAAGYKDLFAQMGA